MISVDAQTTEYIERVLEKLKGCTTPGIVWSKGLMHPGGPHYRVSISVSIGRDECQLFKSLVETFRPEHCFIIGNAFGYSCAIIALAMMDNGGQSIITLDPRTEGDGQRCARIADELVKELDLSIVTNKCGFSPQDTAEAVERDVHELIFIDGLHAHPQVTEDFDGAIPYSDDDTIFVWHDFWLPGIPECVVTAKERGYLCWWVPTSCEMVIGTKNPDKYEQIKQLFPHGAEECPARSRLQHLRAGAFALTCRETGRFLDWAFRHRGQRAGKI